MSALLEVEGTAEEVVLVNASGEPVGTMLKRDAHHDRTPLHLAFSLFLFDGKGRFLVQQRALHKLTWPGVWSNSCCGHPAPDEPMEGAVYRRTRYELGCEILDLRCALPQFQYRARWENLWENEICPVWIGRLEETPRDYNREEVNAVDWVEWEAFAAASDQAEGSPFEQYSPWSLLEARELKRSAEMKAALADWGLAKNVSETQRNLNKQ